MCSPMCAHPWVPAFVAAPACRHPASGYVQGINDLVTPFLAVFMGEHFPGRALGDWALAEISDDQVCVCARGSARVCVLFRVCARVSFRGRGCVRVHIEGEGVNVHEEVAISILSSKNEVNKYGNVADNLLHAPRDTHTHRSSTWRPTATGASARCSTASRTTTRMHSLASNAPYFTSRCAGPGAMLVKKLMEPKYLNKLNRNLTE